jgi:hypothetical protein
MNTPRVQPRSLAEVEREYAASQATSSPVSAASGKLGLVMGYHQNPLKHHVKDLLEAIQANNYANMQNIVNSTQDNLEWLATPNRKKNTRNYLFVFYANLFRFYALHLISHHNNQPISEIEAKMMFKMLTSESFIHDKLQLETKANTPGSQTHVDNTTYIKNLANEIIKKMKTYYQRLINGFVAERTRTQRKLYDPTNISLKVDFIIMASKPNTPPNIKELPISDEKLQKIYSLLEKRDNLYNEYYTELDDLLDSYLLGEIELLKLPRGAIARHERYLREIRIAHQKNSVQTAGILSEINLELKTIEPRLKKFVNNPDLQITDPGAGGGRSIKLKRKKNYTRRMN